MICVGYFCDNCKHIFKENIDGWKPGCDAFPQGIPNEIILETDVTKLPECNNGIKYEPKESGD